MSDDEMNASSGLSRDKRQESDPNGATLALKRIMDAFIQWHNRHSSIPKRLGYRCNWMESANRRWDTSWNFQMPDAPQRITMQTDKRVPLSLIEYTLDYRSNRVYIDYQREADYASQIVLNSVSTHCALLFLPFYLASKAISEVRDIRPGRRIIWAHFWIWKCV